VVTMTEFHRAMAELRAELLGDPVVRLLLRNAPRLGGAVFLLATMICICMGLFSAWQIFDEVVFVLAGVCLLLADSSAWRAHWKGP
jgi:hypothetical protein